MTWHLMGGKYDVCGSLGLTEFQKNNIPAVCESDMDGLVTDILGNHITGGQGFMGDFMIDTFNGVTVYAHCQAPVNPHGDDRVPYTIRDHGGRTVLQMRLPVDGEITAVRVNLLERKISVHTGELIDGESIYRDFTESSCRTKLVAKVNARLIHENFDYGTFTNHLVVYYGDIREKIKNLASLVGFEAMEEDR
jgi:L-fucose isomerase-like protein